MKDFDGWNIVKKTTDDRILNFFFKQQEVWWMHCGINIGIESNGKGEEFARPVLIIKKHNKNSCLVISLTTKHNNEKSNIQIDQINHPGVYANLSQIRVVDSRRLISRMFFLNKDNFARVRDAIRIFNGL